jgi:S1-C subfamily serine protease
MQVETLAEQLLFFTTCHLASSSAEGDWVGTGFVYSVQTSKGTAMFIATNKHVLSGADTLTLKFIAGDAAGNPVLGRRTSVTLTGGY